MSRTSIGRLACLVDDSIISILCLCDILDLLRIQQLHRNSQTCKYLHVLAAEREIWYSILCRVPRELTPAILPGQKREEVDLRDLALKAMKGHKNWTSGKPRPVWQISLDLRHSDREFDDLQLLPGGEFLLYFAKGSLYCFDVKRNCYLLEYKSHISELFQFSHQMQADADSVKISALGRSNLKDVMTIQLETLMLNLRNGDYELLSESSVEWSSLCEAVDGDYIMLGKPILSEKHVAIPYVAGTYVNERRSRGAITINYADSSVVLANLNSCDDTDMDVELSISCSGNYMFYITGRDSHTPVVHAVPLSLFEEHRRDFDDSSKWINFDVRPEHDVAAYSLHIPSPRPRVRINFVLYPSTWLDLDRTRAVEPLVESVSLLDVVFAWQDNLVHSTDFRAPRSMRNFQLKFAELSTVSDATIPSGASCSKLSGKFLCDDLALGEEDDEQEIVGAISDWMPSRSGRVATVISAGEERLSRAIGFQVNARPHSTLDHLDDRAVHYLTLDYYTGTLLHISYDLDSNFLVPIRPTARVIVEGYD